MADIRHIIGDRIRELRKEKGLSQEALGWKAKLHYTYVGAVERGEKNVSIVTLDKIAKALRVNLNKIFCIPENFEDPMKVKASLLEEIDKSDPAILRIALGLIRQVNTLKPLPPRKKH